MNKRIENYPAFVAETGQVNTPPGSYFTIKEWIRNSFISQSSNVLEIGCSTGFISSQICVYTKAKVTGIDSSEECIRKANSNIENTNLESRCNFQIGNAEKLNFDEATFTHVIIGGHLPWVQPEKRANHIYEAARVLGPNGFLLTSLYFYRVPPPTKFVKQFNSEFNTRLEPKNDYTYWQSLFEIPELEAEYESLFDVNLPSEERKAQYLSVFSLKHRADWERKVNLFIENGKYIRFFVKIFRKYAPNDKMRQFPRGGIYACVRRDEKCR